MPKLRLIMSTIILIGLSAAGYAADRVALVVGNSQYAHAPSLPNPTNDASDISVTLKRLGFKVTTVKDLGFEAMRRALLSFSSEAIKAEMAVIFYAGHGMEVNKQNYLVPTDAKLDTDRDIPFEAIPLELVTNSVSGARKLRLVMLDACRNNPFAASMKMTRADRSLGRGLARIEPEAGTLVSFAAKEGTVASDGTGRNSPYTRALLKHMESPGLEINFLFREVRDAVMKDTNRQQQPFVYGSLGSQRIYLKGGAATDPAPLPAAPSGNAGQAGSSAALELALWNAVKDSNDPDMLRQYVSKYPSGVFAGVANQLIRRLTTRQPEPARRDEQRAEPEQDVARLPLRSRTIRGPQGTIHLGDEYIRGWARVRGLCISVRVPQVAPGGLVRLRYKGFGVEDAYARLGNMRKRLPRMRNRRGKRRPNYWSGYTVIEFPLRRGFAGGRLSICSARVRNPEKPGDKDDLQLRGISVEVVG
ncbi:MAG: caspase family protein [Pseudomonadota bacterium]